MPCTGDCLIGVDLESLNCRLLFTVCINPLLSPHHNSASAFLPPVATSRSTFRTTDMPKDTSVRRSPRTLPTSHSQCASTHASCPPAGAASSVAAAYTSLRCSHLNVGCGIGSESQRSIGCICVTFRRTTHRSLSGDLTL